MFPARLVHGDRVLLLLLLAAAWPMVSYGQQCIEGPVDGFKVHSVKFSSFLGRVPETLTQKLDAHQGENYSPEKPGLYMKEIDAFLENDEAQQKYERLIANQLKLSIKGVFTSLECVERVAPEECEKAMPGNSRCVDVKIKRYAVEINALNSSPFLLLFPQSAATVLYGAIPRPLLALNPGFNASVDRQFGPAIGLDTATDLLNLGPVLTKVEPNATPVGGVQPVNPMAPVTPPVAPESLVVVPVSTSTGSTTDDTAASMGDTTSLLLRLSGRKSLNDDFYGASGRVVLQHRKPALNRYQGFALETAFDASHVPLGDGDFLRNAGRLSFSNSFRPKDGPIRVLDFGVGYRRSSDRVADVIPSTREAGMENTFEARVIADGSLGKGLTRVAVWFDHGVLDEGRCSYERIATRLGYGKEFVIHRKREFRAIKPPELGGQECWTSYPTDPKRNESTIGVEVIAGGGRTWGSPPPNATFWGGNPQGQFLYDELSAQTLTNFPMGPVLRSFGRNQLGVGSGSSSSGTTYWHSNLNVSVPVPPWSRPLIPYEWVAASRLGDGDEAFKGHVPDNALICRDLKHTIKTLVGKSGMNLLINQQARDELSDAEKKALRLRNKENRTPEESMRLQAAEDAFAEAKRRLKPQIEDLFSREILPVTNFIADHANMFSVKPLFLFDAAHVGLSGSQTPTRYGAGGGLQVDIVTARFEFAYIAALNRNPGDPPGNFVGRLVLRNFF